MIKVNRVKTYGFESAVHGMRSPYNSWDKSDSRWVLDDMGYEHYRIGQKDLELMRRLFKAGTEHRKFMRQIFVSMDLTAPLYWYKQFDTYRIGVTANSCSTMHTIMAHEFTEKDFSCDAVCPEEMGCILMMLNHRRNAYLCEHDPELKRSIWRGLIQLLPEGYNQTRTVTMNYEVAATICRQRSGHKLGEWHDLIRTLKLELPYLEEIMDGPEGSAEGSDA